MKLVDIGTGDGRVLKEVFLQHSGMNFMKVLGTDRRINVINFAQDTYGSDSINFEVLDIEHGSDEQISKVIEESQFDFATSFFCLHYVRDFKRTFNNINKLLRLEGSFYFNFVASCKLNDIHLELAEKFPMLKKIILDKYPILANIKDFEKRFSNILLQSGFKIDFLNFEIHEFDFKNEKGFRGKFLILIVISKNLIYKICRYFFNFNTFLYELNDELYKNVMNQYVAINEKVSKLLGENLWVMPITYVHGLITKISE